MKKCISSVTIELMRGDITNQKDIEAVVNAANGQLMPGGGVAGAIHRAAGPGLYEECRPLAPIKTGEAVITSGHNLPNKHVIHCLGPIYGSDKPEDKLLASCYSNALKIAEEKNVKSIAFPAISTGIFGYPVKDAAAVALNTILINIPKLKNIKTIRFVLYSQSDFEIHKKVLSNVTS